jgi:phosphopantetheinyl transferase (holo-ACP synthase)
LKKEKEEVLDQLQVGQKEKNEIQDKFMQSNAKMKEEKDQLIAEQIAIKEAMTKALRSMTGLLQEEPDSTEMQVGNLTEAIQQLQARVIELEIQAVSSTPQVVRDQREEDAGNVVEIIRTLTLECKKLSDRSEQSYERLAKDPEMRKLEAQL